MKIKSITIVLEPTGKELDFPDPKQKRTLHFEDAKWKSSDDNGFYPGEIRLMAYMEEAKNKGGSNI